MAAMTARGRIFQRTDKIRYEMARQSFAACAGSVGWIATSPGISGAPSTPKTIPKRSFQGTQGAPCARTDIRLPSCRDHVNINGFQTRMALDECLYNGGEISPHDAWMSESGVYVVSMFIMHTVPLAVY